MLRDSFDRPADLLLIELSWRAQRLLWSESD